MRHFAFAAALAAAIALPAAALAQEATARMINADGQEIGTISFMTTPSGLIHVFTEVTTIPAGAHGFHIHETGTCDPATGFESAGGHFAGGKEHGVMVEGGPHAGDFPNVHAATDGVLKAEHFTDRISLEEGAENPVMDENGSAIVIHANADDYASQPSGDAGGRIACGVIE